MRNQHEARGQRPRRSAGKHSWPTCARTGKQRLGERKDVKLALEAARYCRAAAELAAAESKWTVQRGYRCEFCSGWHLTSKPQRPRRAS